MKGPLIITLLVFLLIGGGFYYAFQKVRTTIDRAIPAGLDATIESIGSIDTAPSGATVRLVSSEPSWIGDVNGDELAEILGSGYVDNEFSIVALDGATGKLLWSTPVTDTSIKLRYFNDVVITAREREIRAYNPSTGASMWAVTLPDKVQLYPFRAYAIDDALVVQSADNALTSVNRQTGAQNWQVTLRERDAQDFQRLADMLCDSERPENVDAIYCYDLKTGAPVRNYALGEDAFTGPLWWSDDQPPEPGFYRLRHDRETITFERVKAADGEPQWSQPLPKGFNRNSASDYTLVSQGGQLAIGSEDFQVAIITAGGAPVIVEQHEKALYPLGFDGSTLYLAAIKQRGTPTLTVQTIDTGSGAVLNTSPEIGNTSNSLDTDVPRWAVVPGQGLLVASQDIENDDIVGVQMIAADGAVRWSYSKTMFIGALPEISLNGNRVLVSTSDFMTLLDARDGKVLWEIAN
jgi:outer membrane protein assembly factor BamB